MQLDIGFGDAIMPGPDVVRYPVILDKMLEPYLRVYPRYTVRAEKLEALTSLGMLNSRMKDCFDLWIWILVRHSGFDGTVLFTAIRTAFEDGVRPFPTVCLSAWAMSSPRMPRRKKQWQSFRRKNTFDKTLIATVVGDHYLF